MAFSSIHEESTWNPTLKINLLIEEPSFTTLILSGARNRIPLRNEFSFIFKRCFNNFKFLSALNLLIAV